MPQFQPGNKEQTKRRLFKGGRPTKDIAFSVELERTAFVAAALSNGEEIGKQYRKRIFENDAVLVDARKWLTDKDDGQTQRPVAIQVVVEAPSQNGNGNGQDAPAPGSWNGGPILIGGD